MQSSYSSAAVETSVAHFLLTSEPAIIKKHILLVEDNPFLQHLHSLWLKELDYDVTVVDSGEAALEKVSSEHDLVLMDLDLPGNDGIVTTQQLLKIISLPVIACTSHAEYDMKDACLSVGMIDYLQKPVSPSLFKQTLAMHSI